MRSFICSFIFVAIVLCGTVCSVQPVLGEEKGEELISLDFNNVDIREAAKLVSDLTGNNFILRNEVRGNITVFAPTKIPKGELLKAFETILDTYGFAMVPAGKFIKIVPANKKRKQNN